MTLNCLRTQISAAMALASCVAMATVAYGQSAPPAQSAEAAKCMALARGDPDIGYKTALAWRAIGGGVPARHCIAVSLLGLGQYSEAAEIQQALAEGAATKGPEHQLELLSQSANAWLIAGKPMTAAVVQTEALKVRPDDVEILIDRSISLSSSEKYWQAIDDLNRALEIDPKRVDALIFRANAYRRLETPVLAEEDISRAIAISPQHPEALLERGNLRHSEGDRDGARGDWLKIIETSPDTPVAAAAKLNLERLDLEPH